MKLFPSVRIRPRKNKQPMMIKSEDLKKFATKEDVDKLTQELITKRREAREANIKLMLAKLTSRQRDKLTKILKEREAREK